ncbi:MAG: RagB/SusD family nutrient uptake outer membrane protein [Pseudoflavonifractor sp.]|nr:RagB/SusD family nutrient uptake outer membrane protein [Pseudoflavonifractor sp.]
MKLNICLMAAASVALASCDNYLDIEPKGRAQLETTDDYLGLLEEVSPSYDHANSWVMSGECSWYKIEELKNYTVPLRSCAYFWDESVDRVSYTIESTLYNNCYSRITNYNAIISNVATAQGPDSDKELAMAQARAMRAYNYFFLVNTFAPPYDPATADVTPGVIVRDRMFESIEEEGIQQSVGYVYNLILQDLDAAIPDLPDRAINAFRPDKTFGWAFKAKVHLFMRDIDKCITACDEALAAAGAGGHELWDMNTEYNRYAPMLRSAYGTDIAIDDPRYMGVNEMIENVWKNAVAYGYDGAENLLYQFGTTYTDPFPMYLRKSVIDLFEHNADLRYRYCIRYRRTHETAPEGDCEYASMGIRWNPGGMRLSEVYLMLAECYARKGSPADIMRAMDYLDTLRSHRHVAGAYTRLTATTREEAMRHVREERKRELFFTNNGFFDMRRFMTEFNETWTRQFEGRTYTIAPGSHLLTYPFPLKAMQTSKLIQNSK